MLVSLYKSTIEGGNPCRAIVGEMDVIDLSGREIVNMLGRCSFTYPYAAATSAYPQTIVAILVDSLCA